MTEKEQIKAAKEFAAFWKDKGYEKGESQKFWIDLLQNVYGVADAIRYISFEDQVHLDHTSFIDGYIEATHVLIEQKGLGKDLRKAIKQSDGTMLSPFQQAKRYSAELPYDKRPRWIVTCNFSDFLVYDMNKPNGEPEQILLKDLPKEYYRLQFLVEQKSEMLKKEEEISLKAGELVGKIYNAILKQYKNPDSPETLKSLNILCVRLVFLLFAEDTELLGQHEMFGRYLAKFPVNEVRKKLIELFEVLDTKIEDRDPYMDDDLAAFPYVNGGLFAEQNIEIPRFTDEIVDLLIDKASAGFDWSAISPAIFGAAFESSLNPETRRSGGLHYTDLSNIHKVIDPLFLYDLKADFAEICEKYVGKTKRAKLEQFRDKLASLTFFDPACGSGNFLTETYISLRRLENQALEEMYGGQKMFGGEGDLNPIKVSISQFYGIEINDFAVTVARTALWIAESQMLHETEEIVEQNLDFLPLKSYANIVEGNALRLDWNEVVPKEKLHYIMGNPPFVGMAWMSKAQKDELTALFPNNKKAGTLDYVSGWYVKALRYIEGTQIDVAFVSTNSICQGEQIGALWKYLSEVSTYTINFAHQTFVWDSEANQKAHVHCVIVGFSAYDSKRDKVLYNNGQQKTCKHINAYLLEGDDVFVDRRTKPICDVPTIHRGNQPTDGGHLIIEEEDYEDFIKREPKAEKYIKRFMMGYEFLNNKKRYCLWLVGVSPKELASMPFVMERIQKVKEMRESSTFEQTRKMAATPYKFREEINPDRFVAIPVVSSERRRYIPMGYLDSNTIPGNKLLIIENAELYHFGVLESNVHMAWMRTVAGRLKSDYSYSKDIVYNCFPWANLTDDDKERISKTAQSILDARALYPDSSLAELYNPLLMPPELIKAHQANDFAVMAAYGFDKKITESECVAELMKMYQKLTK